MESIQLKNDNLFKIGIKNNEGQDTGEVITIDMEDIELPLKLQECETKIKEIKGTKSRCILEGEKPLTGKCVVCGKEANDLVIWGVQY